MKIITVTLSPAYDVHCFSPSLGVGKENTVSLISYDAGGKGVNLSRALFAMGKESVAALVLGEDNASPFLNSMTEMGIDYKIIKIPGRVRENITVHTATGEEPSISGKAEPYRAGGIEKIERVILEALEDDTVAVFAGKLPEGIRESGLNEMLLGLGARGVRLVLDSRSLSIGDIAQIKPYLIKPNLEELGELVGRELKSFEEVKSAAKSLCELGVENVLVSMGAEGAALFGSLGEHFASAPKIKVRSTVGAGDSLLAGFLYAHGRGFSPSECLRWAVASGSAACLTEGTAPPDLENIRKILENMQ